MVKVLLDSSLTQESEGRDYIVDRVIKYLEETKKCHSYIEIEKPKNPEEEEIAKLLFSDYLDKPIRYSWIKESDSPEPVLLVSPVLDKLDKINLDFRSYDWDATITVEPDYIS